MALTLTIFVRIYCLRSKRTCCRVDAAGLVFCCNAPEDEQAHQPDHDGGPAPATEEHAALSAWYANVLGSLAFR